MGKQEQQEVVEGEENSDDQDPELPEEQEPDSDAETPTARPTRHRTAPDFYVPVMAQMREDEAEANASQDRRIEYDEQMALVIANIMCHIRDQVVPNKVNSGVHNVTTYTLKQGINKWGQKVSDLAMKEMKQLIDRDCWKPIHVNTISKSECKRVMRSLLFLIKKRDNTIKSRHCADGSIQ